MGSTIAHSASVRSLGERRPLRSAARRCSGVHIGRSSKENQAPDKESHPIHQTQELPGSALRALYQTHGNTVKSALKAILEKTDAYDVRTAARGIDTLADVDPS